MPQSTAALTLAVVRKTFRCAILNLIVLFTLSLSQPATGQPFPDPNAPSYARGEAIVMTASPRFADDDLGNGYRVDLLGVKGTRLAPARTESERISRTGEWLRRSENEVTLNVQSTAVGMVDVTLPADSPRRVMNVMLYRLKRASRLIDTGVDRIEATPEASLLLTKIYHGHAFNLAIVGTEETFTPEAVAAVRRCYEEDRPLEPVLKRYELKVSASSRGLVTRVPWTAVPDRIPVSWSDVKALYPMDEPEAVFAEYTFLRDVTPDPVQWTQ
ncbi:hypothetical protein CRI94_10305 [Longibacter salinarum]|uniref:Uncharacterized protein n=1 Tax=Longibacter salinarum TaxID=1850348 RepID=A0A2A8CXC4_9BACT|nr:hypothetical protein [Longibacter salinarum]PEN13038.1 hypothetical protein CRI94_10305 [Longibacter salinarum]